MNQKKYSQFLFIASAFAAVIAVFWGATLVWGAWNEPGTTPPLGNVSAPINVGGDTQVKVGSISAHDVWSDEAQVWMKELYKTEWYTLDPAANWPAITVSSPNSSGTSWPQGFNETGGFRILATPTQQTGVARFPTNGTWSINGYNILPPNIINDPSRVKGLIVKVFCSEAMLFLGQGSTAPNISIVHPTKVCSAGNNITDSTEVLVPVRANLPSGQPGLFLNYQVVPTDPPSFGTYVDVIGLVWK